MGNKEDGGWRFRSHTEARYLVAHTRDGKWRSDKMVATSKCGFWWLCLVVIVYWYFMRWIREMLQTWFLDPRVWDAKPKGLAKECRGTKSKVQYYKQHSKSSPALDQTHCASLIGWLVYILQRHVCFLTCCLRVSKDHQPPDTPKLCRLWPIHFYLNELKMCFPLKTHDFSLYYYTFFTHVNLIVQ